MSLPLRKPPRRCTMIQEPECTDTSNRIKVLVRIRPFIPLECNGKDERVVYPNPSNPQELILENIRRQNDRIKYAFDYCYDQSSTQEDIFNKEIVHVIQNFLNGINASIFCTGMTGAGKTYTMQGTTNDPGIIPRTIQHIFKLSSDYKEFKLSLSYFEIYNEKVYDLLDPKDQECVIREDVDHKITISNLTRFSISSTEEFFKLYEMGVKNRKTASTKLNHLSSRSHAMLIVNLKISHHLKCLQSKLNLIDLAGNEDNKHTENHGIRLAESASINSSLFVLAKVMQALNVGEKRIPFRDSKLTRILQDSLGGNCLSVMIANVAPGLNHYAKTSYTLNFASKSRHVVNFPIVNEVSNPKNTQKTNFCQKKNTKFNNDHISTSIKASNSNGRNQRSLHTRVGAQSAFCGYITVRDRRTPLKHKDVDISRCGGIQLNDPEEMQYPLSKSQSIQHLDLKENAINRGIPMLNPKAKTTTTKDDFFYTRDYDSTAIGDMDMDGAEDLVSTPYSKTKRISQQIDRARRLEDTNPSASLSIYSRILSNVIKNQEFIQLKNKLKTRIDKLLAKMTDSEKVNTFAQSQKLTFCRNQVAEVGKDCRQINNPKFPLDDVADGNDQCVDETRSKYKKRKVPSSDNENIDALEKSAKEAIGHELGLFGFSTEAELGNVLNILNSGSSKEVQKLYGIGKVRADQIVERAKVSPFTALEQLVHVGLREKFILTFLKKNIFEVIYYSKTMTSVGSYERPITFGSC